MHLIKDENGNLVQHGHADSHEHTHEHTHEDGVTHSHTHSHAEGDNHCHTHGDGHCGSCENGDCKNETVALLTYMLQHNELNMDAAAKTIKEAVADFQKGNMRLGLALTLVKEELK